MKNRIIKTPKEIRHIGREAKMLNKFQNEYSFIANKQRNLFVKRFITVLTNHPKFPRIR